MSLRQWLDNRWIITVERSATHVANLLALADREIGDASSHEISCDGRFNHAYAAVRDLCELALHAGGYKIPKGGREHERSIQSLKFTLGDRWADDVDFLDRCRRLRHQSLYERIGVVQQEDADELLGTARKLAAEVRQWLRQHHPGLLSQ